MNCRFVTGATECCVYATIVGSVDVGRGGETPSAGNAESKIPREPDGAAFYPQVLGFGLVIIDIETAGNNRDPLLDDRAQPLDTRRAGRPLKALAETFHQDFADRLRPSWLRIFFLNPAVQRRKLIGLEPDLNLDALTGRNRASFLWYQSFLTAHVKHGTTVVSRGEGSSSPPGSHRNRLQGRRSWLTQNYLSKRTEEKTSELQSLMRISYAVYSLHK